MSTAGAGPGSPGGSDTRPTLMAWGAIRYDDGNDVGKTIISIKKTKWQRPETANIQSTLRVSCPVSIAIDWRVVSSIG
jgi:hypothetical protein